MSRVRAGHLLMAIGVIHCITGIFLGFPHLADIVQAGVFNAVTDDEPWRMAIFWFEAFGLLAIGWGASWSWAEARGLRLPRSQAILSALIAVTGVICIPLSGFWLLFPLSALIWVRSSQEKDHGHRMKPASRRL